MLENSYNNVLKEMNEYKETKDTTFDGNYMFELSKIVAIAKEKMLFCFIFNCTSNFIFNMLYYSITFFTLEWKIFKIFFVIFCCYFS